MKEANRFAPEISGQRVLVAAALEAHGVQLAAHFAQQLRHHMRLLVLNQAEELRV